MDINMVNEDGLTVMRIATMLDLGDWVEMLAEFDEE